MDGNSLDSTQHNPDRCWQPGMILILAGIHLAHHLVLFHLEPFDILSARQRGDPLLIPALGQLGPD